MASIEFELNESDSQFVDELIRDGVFTDATQVLAAGLRSLREEVNENGYAFVGGDDRAQ